MKLRRIILIIFLVLVGASIIYALMDQRKVTTSSDKAYQAYLRGEELTYRLYTHEALDEFEKAVKLDPNFASAYTRLAWLYKSFDRDREYQDAKNRALGLLDRVKDKEKLVINLTFARLEDKAADVDRFKQELLTKFPDSFEAREALANDYFARMDYQKSIEENLKILKIDPEFASGYNILAYSYFHIGEYDKALESIDKYSSLAPDQANPYDSHGELLLYLGRYDEALEQFRKADSIKQGLYFVMSHIGDTYKEKGMYRDAIGAYLKAREISPNERIKANIDDNIAICYIESNQMDKGVEILKEVIGRNPGELKANAILGDIYSREGKMEEALLQLGIVKGITSQLLASGAPDNKERLSIPNAEHYTAGRIALAKGDYGEAISHFSTLYTMSSMPDKVLFGSFLGESLLKAGQADSAIAVLTSVLKNNPNSGLCLRFLADAYGQFGQKDAQRGALARYLTVMKDADEGNKEVGKALTQLEQLGSRNP